MKYSKEETEFIKVKLESNDNYAHISRQFIATFGTDRAFQAVRIKVADMSKDIEFKGESKRKPIKRLFFDIETSYMTARVWRTGKQWVDANNLIDTTKIICIAYKWQEDNKVKTLVWSKKQDDSALIKKFIKVLGEADEIVAHNGDRFDIKQLRTRAIKENLLMFPQYRTLDTLKKARKYFSFPSNRLDYIGKFLEVGRKLDHEGFQMWIDVIEGKSQEKLNQMVEYCQQDVILLEDVFHVLSPYVDHNTNFAVHTGGKKWMCPHCGGGEVQMHHTDTTAMGYIKRHMKCKCKKQYHISNKTYIQFLKDSWHKEL